MLRKICLSICIFAYLCCLPMEQVLVQCVRLLQTEQFPHQVSTETPSISRPRPACYKGNTSDQQPKPHQPTEEAQRQCPSASKATSPATKTRSRTRFIAVIALIFFAALGCRRRPAWLTASCRDRPHAASNVVFAASLPLNVSSYTAPSMEMRQEPFCSHVPHASHVLRPVRLVFKCQTHSSPVRKNDGAVPGPNEQIAHRQVFSKRVRMLKDHAL